MEVFRITNNGQYTNEEFVSFVENNSEFKMVVEYKTYDPPQGEHIHGYCDSGLSKQAIAVRIKQQLHCDGQKDYSISQKERTLYKTPEGYKAYICKSVDETIKPRLYYNLSEEEISKYHKVYWDKHKEIIEKKKSGKSEGVKEKLFEFVSKHGKSIDAQDVIPVILNYFRQEDKIVSNSQVENYYYYIIAKLDPKTLQYRTNMLIERLRL